MRYDSTSALLDDETRGWAKVPPYRSAIMSTERNVIRIMYSSVRIVETTTRLSKLPTRRVVEKVK